MWCYNKNTSDWNFEILEMSRGQIIRRKFKTLQYHPNQRFTLTRVSQYVACSTSIADGYSISDVQYIWTHGASKSIKMASDMRLSQFDLIKIPAGNETLSQPHGNEIMF